MGAFASPFLLLLLALAAGARSAASSLGEAVDLKSSAKAAYFTQLLGKECPFREWLFHPDGKPVKDHFDQIVFACEHGFDDQVIAFVRDSANDLVACNNALRHLAIAAKARVPLKLAVERVAACSSTLSHTTSPEHVAVAIRHNTRHVQACNNALLRTACAANRINVAFLLLDYGANARIAFDEPIISAASHGNIPLVDRLIAHGADIHAREGAPLAAAASKGHLHMVRYLLHAGASPRTNFDIALTVAAENGHLGIVRILEGRGASARTRDYRALLGASAGGHLPVVEFLLSTCATGESSALPRAMREAGRFGHEDIVEFFADRGVSWGHVYEDNDSIASLASGPLAVIRYAVGESLIEPGKRKGILKSAAMLGRQEIVRHFLTTTDRKNGSAFLVMKNGIIGKNFEMVKDLLADYAHELSEENRSALIYEAMLAGSVELCTSLEALGATASLSNAHVGRVVNAAARSGSLRRMKWLMQKAISVSPRAQGALKYAVASGSVEMVQFLIGHGAVLDASTKDGCLESAILASKVSTLKFVLEHLPGSTVDYARCFVYAAMNNSMEMVAFVESSGAPIWEHVDDAAAKAASAGHIEMMRYLMSISGDGDATCKVAVAAAYHHGHNELVRFFLAFDQGRYYAVTMAKLLAAATSQQRLYSCEYGTFLDLFYDVPPTAQIEMIKVMTARQKLWQWNDRQYRKAARTARRNASDMKYILELLYEQAMAVIRKVTTYSPHYERANMLAAIRFSSSYQLPCWRTKLVANLIAIERAIDVLLEAASRGEANLVNTFLLNGVPIDSCGQAALQSAIENGRDNIIGLLGTYDVQIESLYA